MGPPAGSPGRPLSTAPLAHRCPPLPDAAGHRHPPLPIADDRRAHRAKPAHQADRTATRPRAPPGSRHPPHRSPHPTTSPCTWRRRRHRRRTFRMRTASSQRRRRPDTSRSPRIAVLTTKVRPQSASNRPASTMTDLRPEPTTPQRPRLKGAAPHRLRRRRTMPKRTAGFTTRPPRARNDPVASCLRNQQPPPHSGNHIPAFVQQGAGEPTGPMPSARNHHGS